MNPTFSFIIPAYNAEEYLSDAIESCLNQTYSPLEILVADDGSTDQTWRVIEAYVDKITSFRHSNVGQSSTLNQMISKASGDYVVLLDADDLNAPQRLERVAAAINDGATDIICHDAWHRLPDGSHHLHSHFVRWPIGDQFPALCRANFAFGNPAIKRSLFDKIGVFNDSLKLGEDFEFFLRYVLSGGRLTNVIEPLYVYRIHNMSKTADLAPVVRSDIAILRSLLRNYPLSFKQRWALLVGITTRLLSIDYAWSNATSAVHSAAPRLALLRIALHRRSTLRVRIKAFVSFVIPNLWRT